MVIIVATDKVTELINILFILYSGKLCKGYGFYVVCLVKARGLTRKINNNDSLVLMSPLAWCTFESPFDICFYDNYLISYTFCNIIKQIVNNFTLLVLFMVSMCQEQCHLIIINAF